MRFEMLACSVNTGGISFAFAGLLAAFCAGGFYALNPLSRTGFKCLSNRCLRQPVGRYGGDSSIACAGRNIPAFDVPAIVTRQAVNHSPKAGSVLLENGFHAGK